MDVWNSLIIVRSSLCLGRQLIWATQVQQRNVKTLVFREKFGYKVRQESCSRRRIQMTSRENVELNLWLYLSNERVWKLKWVIFFKKKVTFAPLLVWVNDMALHLYSSMIWPSMYRVGAPKAHILMMSQLENRLNCRYSQLPTSELEIRENSRLIFTTINYVSQWLREREWVCESVAVQI